jgi:hypothetical protein
VDSGAHARAVMAAHQGNNDDEQPEPDEEVIVDQLTAFEFKLSMVSAPRSDFGMWNPFGGTGAAGLRCVASGFKVFSAVTRALQAATHTRLLVYVKKIGGFNDTYGAICWWLTQTHPRVRSDQLERIRRRLELEKLTALAAGSVHPLHAATPWDLRFKKASAGAKFWDEELRAKAVLCRACQVQAPAFGPAPRVGDGRPHSGCGAAQPSRRQRQQ